MKISRLAAAFTAFLSLQPMAAHALAVCTASATPVNFGPYDPLSVTPRTTTASVTVSCDLLLGISLLVAYSISLSQGSGSYPTRTLRSGANVLNYNLFTNSFYSSIWGDGSGGTSRILDGYLLGLGGAVTNYPIYARIPALQNVASGIYTDTILVTITY